MKILLILLVYNIESKFLNKKRKKKYLKQLREIVDNFKPEQRKLFFSPKALLRKLIDLLKDPVFHGFVIAFLGDFAFWYKTKGTPENK